MTDLETRLAELGARWDTPEAPDMVGEILAGHSSQGHRRARPRRIVLALAAAAIGIGALAAIAPARNAVLNFFDIGGVRVVTTPTTTPPTQTLPTTTPPPSAAAPNPLGESISLDAARTRAPFPLRLPTIPGPDPDRVFVQAPPQDGAFAFVWRDAGDIARGTLVLTQFRGELVAEKLLDPAVTTVQKVDVDTVSGYWLSGGPHTVGYVDAAGAFRTETTRTVGDVLIWERASVTYRIEGAASLSEGLRVAASLS